MKLHGSRNQKLFYLFLINEQRPTIDFKRLSKCYNKTRDCSQRCFNCVNSKYTSTVSSVKTQNVSVSSAYFATFDPTSSIHADNASRRRFYRDRAARAFSRNASATRHREILFFCSLIRSFPRALASNALQRRYSSTAFNGTRHGESRGKIGAEVNEMQRTEKVRE